MFSPPTGYNPRFDVLRGWACIGVIACHAENLFPLGWAGLLGFYVLSGYLVSRSFLSIRQKGNEGTRLFGEFFRRRAVRILPLYWLYLFLLVILAGVGIVTSKFWGVLPSLVGGWFNWICAFGTQYLYKNFWFGHLWSLTLEMQFYLLCPFVLLFFPRKHLAKFLWVLVLLAPLFRWMVAEGMVMAGRDGMAKLVAVYYSSFTYVDGFALGALVALRKRPESSRRDFWSLVGFVGFMVVLVLGLSFLPGGSFPTWGYAFGFPHLHGSQYGYLWGYSVLHLFFYFLVKWLDTEPRLPWLLDNPLLRYLGEISYGMYIYHVPLLMGFYLFFHGNRIVGSSLGSAAAVAPPALWQLWMGFFLLLVGTAAIAAASYQFWEKRWLRRRA